MLLFFGGKIDVERYMSLSQIKTDYNVTSSTGRLEIWKTGIKLILSHPITGVGLNCFPKAIGHDRAAQDLPSSKWQVAHNSYVQLAAEVGLIGFAIFLSLIIGCIRNFLSCSRLENSNPDLQKLKFFGGVFLVGFTGNLICGLFLAQGYSVIFTLFFAFSAVLRKLYRNLEDTV
jgi:O-antigen ligase